MKKYKVGLYIGRFQPYHLGHHSIIKKMAQECEVVIIAVGSAQESGTEHNPFSYEMRRSMIWYSIYRIVDDYRIVGVPDRENPSEDPSWTKYLLKYVFDSTGLMPEVIYQGDDQVRENWYDGVDIKVEIVPRNKIPISASLLRKVILADDYWFFTQFVTYAVDRRYDEMREILCEIKGDSYYE